ncbi:MAG TPA: FISUMP domain-containing protein, partial [Thermotogota bacterium]|nr:FISUMP domain-containing protein [Thermotogota bacterium]
MKVLGKGYGFILVILLSVTAFSALDGFNPETILIGKQVWMLKNYHPSMISPAPKVKGVSYLFRSNIDPKYGTLLTYEEAVAACPEGWHLPTMAEWNELFALYGGLDIAGGHLKTVDFWKAPNTGADNLSGFSALPAGGGNDTNRFDGFDWSAHFWSDTLKDGKVFVPTLMHDS